jgi:hypothetical protein
MQQAEEVAVNDAVVLTRVKSARMSLDYAIVERARSEMKNKLPANDKLIGLARDRFTPFTETLKKSALKQLGESWPLDKDVYCRDLAVDLQVQK